MNYPCKIGLPIYPDIKDDFETEPREYLIASRNDELWGPIYATEYGGSFGGTPIKQVIHAHAAIAAIST